MANTTNIQTIMYRFPRFELSYETIPHKKVSPAYNIALAIPYGRKYYAWFTFLGNENVCILMELNREKRISKTEVINTLFDPSLALGTILYGAIEERSQVIDSIHSQSFFVVEDIFYFRGLSMKSMQFSERLGYICQTMELLTPLFDSPDSVKQVVFCVPAMCKMTEMTEYTPKYSIFDANTMAYVPHHIQYRCLTRTEPVLNVFPAKINLGPVVNTSVSTIGVPHIPYKANYNKPQYRLSTPTVFIVMADIQCDIYRLYAYGSNRSFVYYGLAGIPNYHTSVFMNSLFRNIKENRNLDYIEESDDEDEFENTDNTRFVHLEKRELIECIFHSKFKKWIPIRSVKESSCKSQLMVVHISKL